MSLDNTATFPDAHIIELDGGHADDCRECFYEASGVKELLIDLHRRFDKVESIAENVQEQFAPILEKIGNNPMLKMLLK